MIENIEVFSNNSIRISDDGKTIYCDPYDIKSAYNDADYILITHDHYDHFSPEDIKKAACERSILVVPEKMERKAEKVKGVVSKIVTVKPGEARDIDGLALETVPAYNIMKPFHTKGAGWVGYIITAGGKRIYIAGDTDATKEAQEVKCDIALVPAGGTYTMDARKAAELVNTISPDTAIPVHYGSVAGKPGDGEVFAANVKDTIKVELKLHF